MPRRSLLAIALLAAILHGVGMSRSPLPAQDGLKFLRVARAFRAEPWTQVIRDSDQHPLYPAAIAALHPLVAIFAGDSADSWRIAAQGVSALASILSLIPIFGLAGMIFDAPTAAVAALLFAVLPIPAELGRDTLSDPLALLGVAWSLNLGATALRSGRLGPAIGCGLAAGLGYLTRPEAAIAPVAVLVVGAIRMCRGGLPVRSCHGVALASASVAFLTMVGAYAVVKGEVSEKLAIRRAVGVSSVHDFATHGPRLLPPGLDDPRWDFSAKEESDAPARFSVVHAIGRLIARWCEGMGLLLVPFVVIGTWMARGRLAATLSATYSALFAAVLIRHAATFGYLSSRHALSLVLVGVIFAAGGVMACVRSVRAWRDQRSPNGSTFIPRLLAVGMLVAVAVSVQFHRPAHQSRWGHGEAAKYLATHCSTRDQVLDTRGWAAFASGRSAHDYWHVRQALLDPHLAFVVVGEDERTADSPRGATLRAVLAFATEPVAAFPERFGGEGVGVRIYRFHSPSDWRGIAR